MPFLDWPKVAINPFFSMKKNMRKMMTLLLISGSVIVCWIALTVVAQMEGPEKLEVIESDRKINKALLVYNPDLFYNLDEQVCESIAAGLLAEGWSSTIATVAAAKKLDDTSFNLFVFCANTYNWAPDRPTSAFIETHSGLKGKNVIAITLGSGSTKKAQQQLEEKIREKEARLLESRAFWLMRPNDPSRSDEQNVKVALEKAHSLGQRIAQVISNK